MRYLQILMILGFLFSCNSTVEKEKANKLESSKRGKRNFAVVWKWSHADENYVKGFLDKIGNEMSGLWNEGVIFDLYYDASPEVNKLGSLPSVSFFMTADSEPEARKFLNTLTLASERLAQPSIFPVGTKWLGRATEKINERGLSESWVASWKTIKKPDLNSDAEIIQKQNDKLLSLQQKGDIENVYWDLKETNNPEKTNEIVDFVFFVNAESEEEARQICNELPFTHNGIAEYHMQKVGVFWLEKK